MYENGAKVETAIFNQIFVLHAKNIFVENVQKEKCIYVKNVTNDTL